MGKLDQPGYPLPSGELGEDEIVCQLIFLPDRSEYWQALLGAISYMATWRAWERDSDKRGKDAAANWREAFELTMGCWRMTCLEDLANTVTDILELLQTRKDCCDDNITYLPTEPIETDIAPEQGDPPDFYGETAVADWDEWLEHVCYNAHEYVDYLAHAGDQLYTATQSSSIFIGLIAALLSLLAFSGIGLPIAFGLAAAVVAGIVLTGTTVTFTGTEQAIEDARVAIVCSIMSGGGLADAVEDALESGLDWDLFYQFIDYDTAMAVIYEGGVGSEFLPTETREDCGCDDEFELVCDGVGTVTGKYTVNSGFDDGCHKVTLLHLRRKSDGAPARMTINEISAFATGTCDGEFQYVLFDWIDEESVRIYESNTRPIDVHSVTTVFMQRSFAFNGVTVNWSLEGLS